MRLKNRLSDDCQLYVILDRQVQTYSELFEILRRSLSAGIDILQLRDKTGSAKEILEFSNRVLKLTKGRIPYIINDRIDLALASGASGVHLGQDDVPLSQARKIVGSERLIGISCQTLAQAKAAQEGGADYIGFGSVFKTLTKPERGQMDLGLLRKVVRRISIPVFAIGGINQENISVLAALGVKRVAVCRSVCQSQNISRAVSVFKKSLSDSKIIF